MATTTDLDLRDRSDETLREQLFEVLAETDAGEELDVVADRDLDPDLVRFQIERGRTVYWAYATPDEEPRELRLTVDGPLDGDDRPSVDVRDLKPQRRHEALQEIFDELAAGQGFVLVNDHDPKPLYHELRSMHGDVVEWEYEDSGPGEWRVEIVKTGDSTPVDEGVVTRYDVREIPKAERHGTIHHRYGMIPEGGTMELVAPHEPRPLRQEFRRQYGDSFTWDVVESEPGRCTVRITKEAAVDEAPQEEPSAETDGEASSSGNEGLDVTEELDVRDLPPAQRHEEIFDAYAGLQAGEAFVFVNDHDPKPLYHQFEAEAGDEFRWEYRLQEPGEFRVLIGKHDATPDDSTSSEDPGAPF